MAFERTANDLSQPGAEHLNAAVDYLRLVRSIYDINGDQRTCSARVGIHVDGQTTWSGEEFVANGTLVHLIFSITGAGCRVMRTTGHTNGTGRRVDLRQVRIGRGVGRTALARCTS